jgi:trehalose/maltose transport system permease protein
MGAIDAVGRPVAAATSPAERATRWAAWAGLWLVLLLALIISIGPFLYMFALSLMDNQQLFAGRVVPWPVFPDNYPRAWVATKIGQLYWNSLYISTVSTLITVAISALAGYGLGRLRFFGRGAIYALILIGLTIPLQIALIPLFVNLRALGLMNTPLALIGPYTAFGLAFGTYIMKGFFEELPRELEEAARIDGASDFRIFWQIMLPLTRPALATIAIFLFLQNWNEFLFALTFTSSNAQRTVPVAIALLSGASQFETPWGNIMAASVIVTVPLVVLVLVFQRKIVPGLTAGGVKG